MSHEIEALVRVTSFVRLYGSQPGGEPTLVNLLDHILSQHQMLGPLYRASLVGSIRYSEPIEEFHRKSVLLLYSLCKNEDWWPLYSDFDAFMTFCALVDNA